jgi:polyhydroxybutyrate depolymerase
MTGMSALADQEGFIVAAPAGVGASWNAGACCGQAHEQGVDDVGFTRAILDELASELNIDPKRVFATGMSNGARFTHRLGCELSDRIAAIAPVAGVLTNRNLSSGEVAFQCQPSRPVPVFEIHGLADGCSPYNGGAGVGGPFVNPSVPDTIQTWVTIDGCSNQTAASAPSASTGCVTHSSCAPGASVTLCSVSQGGHVWPGGNQNSSWRECGGEWVMDFPATSQIWAFFAANPMR